MNKPRLSLLALAAAFLVGMAENAFCLDDTGKWVSSAAAGLTLTRGNSETLLATISGTTLRKWDHNELNFGIEGTYGESKVGTNTTKNAESARAFAQYNRLFTERLYGYGRVEYLHDGIADIRYRVSVSPGAGYYLIKEKTSDLVAEVGPGYVWDDLGGVSRHYATIRFAEKFHLQLSDRARIWETVEFLPQIDDFSNYIVNGEIGIEADLTADKRLSLRSYIQDTYNNEPALGREKNDVKLVTAIAYKF